MITWKFKASHKYHYLIFHFIISSINLGMYVRMCPWTWSPGPNVDLTFASAMSEGLSSSSLWWVFFSHAHAYQRQQCMYVFTSRNRNWHQLHRGSPPLTGKPSKINTSFLDSLVWNWLQCPLNYIRMKLSLIWQKATILVYLNKDVPHYTDKSFQPRYLLSYINIH